MADQKLILIVDDDRELVGACGPYWSDRASR